VATYPEGDVYEGLFKAGKREGQGKLTYASGEVAEGVWQNGILTAPPEAPADGEAPAAPAEGTAPAEPAANP
jgi:MORN repeat